MSYFVRRILACIAPSHPHVTLLSPPQVDRLAEALQLEKGESLAYREKWAQETARSDGVKRETLRMIIKCEEHVVMLQQQHLAELGQRDYILQRCKDTIVNLEARVTGRCGGWRGAIPVDICYMVVYYLYNNPVRECIKSESSYCCC